MPENPGVRRSIHSIYPKKSHNVHRCYTLNTSPSLPFSLTVLRGIINNFGTCDNDSDVGAVQEYSNSLLIDLLELGCICVTNALIENNEGKVVNMISSGLHRTDR